jgi:hypothetical protein
MVVVANKIFSTCCSGLVQISNIRSRAIALACTIRFASFAACNYSFISHVQSSTSHTMTTAFTIHTSPVKSSSTRLTDWLT